MAHLLPLAEMEPALLEDEAEGAALEVAGAEEEVAHALDAA